MLYSEIVKKDLQTVRKLVMDTKRELVLDLSAKKFSAAEKKARKILIARLLTALKASV